MNNSLLQKLCFVALMIASTTLEAKPKTIDAGIGLNTLVPELSVTDIDGKHKTIKQLSGKNGLVLVFFRSADWCPYCKRHLVEINDWNVKINKLGYKVAAISYDSTDVLRAFSTKRNLQYPLLADQNHKTMKDLKVLNDEQEPDDEHYGIPFPGVMILDSEGKLTYKYFYKGYRKRVKMKQLYKRLESMKQ